ncbi:MAG: hypothetical protein WDN28_18855 [Chthoniobacter sp.]
MTEIFDYIRLANSQDTTTTISTGTAIQFAPRGYVVPSKPSYFTTPTQAKGFGRMSTLCEATLDFYYAGPVMVNDKDDPGLEKALGISRKYRLVEMGCGASFRAICVVDGRSQRRQGITSEGSSEPSDQGRLDGGLFAVFDI